jgi:adhesin transport system membrane fusion protein
MATTSVLLPLDTLLLNPPTSFLRPVAKAVMGTLLAFLLWATLAPLQEVAIAEGQVEHLEQMQTVQHLEGGIIEKLLVKEGDRVKKGQALAQLNLTSFTASKEELRINLESLMLKRERLQAEADGKETLVFSPSVAQYRPALLQAEMQVFEGRKLKLSSGLQLLEDGSTQKRLDVEQLVQEKQSIVSNLAVLQEKLNISSNLVKDQLTSRLDHLQLRSDVQELQGKLKIVTVAIPRAEAALKEAEERLRNERITFQNTAREELSEVEMNLARSKEMLGKAQDQVNRTAIKSPINGVVHKIERSTIGSVLKPGETLMEIVPESENLVVKTKLDPNDVGFVKLKQPALVKILAYDFARYGGLDAEVISISPDSHVDEEGKRYFEVVVRTSQNYLGSKSHPLPITSGMMASVDIHTGSKTVMEYLLKPITKVHQEAFRER